MHCHYLSSDDEALSEGWRETERVWCEALNCRHASLEIKRNRESCIANRNGRRLFFMQEKALLVVNNLSGCGAINIQNRAKRRWNDFDGLAGHLFNFTIEERFFVMLCFITVINKGLTMLQKQVRVLRMTVIF